MEGEPETSKTLQPDPSDASQRPASLKSQVIASVFKDHYTADIIGEDTLSNLIKTNKGRSSYRNRYVEALQQAHFEYSQSIKEADMLENHIIIQARAHAAETESQISERMQEMLGHVFDQQGLLPVSVESSFSRCVDSDLLKMSTLVFSPHEDYLTTQKPHMETLAAMKYSPAKPTIAYTKHMSKEPQDDGYMPILSPEKVAPEMNESDLSLTLESSSGAPKGKKTETKPRHKWKDEPGAKDRAEGRGTLQKLKDRQSFLCNPRFLPPNAQQCGTSLIRHKTKVGKVEQSSIEAPGPVFLAIPSVVVFTDYSKGQVYETTLELKNLTSAGRHVKVFQPSTTYFSVGLGRFPSERGVVAPGLSCKYTVHFAPGSLRDYEDVIEVKIQPEDILVVPIKAKRPPPVLTLPRVLDCGHCLVGGVKFVEFMCKNVGLNTGNFCIIPKKQWPGLNLMSLARMYFSEEPPFAVSPPFFLLQPGEAIVLEVVFSPTTAEKSCQVFTLVCDNCQVKHISIEGEGQAISLELVSGKKEPPVAGGAPDFTAEHFVHFGPCNPHSVQQKKITIRNNVHLELPFHWQIMKPNMRPLLPRETPKPSHIQSHHRATDDILLVSPPTGVLGPCQEEEFLFTFCPKEVKNYHSVCHLVLRDVPLLPPEPCSDDGILQPLCTKSKVSNVIVMEIEVNGSTEPYKVKLETDIVFIPGEIYICTTTRKQFKMWNLSKTSVSFQWERWSSSVHIIEVLPPTGRIEENECFVFELVVTGGKPERVVTTLNCHIDHHHEPVPLIVKVSFKGPVVTVSELSVDLGVIQLGQRTKRSLLLTNITEPKASWALRERQDHKDTQISMEPSRGVLPPLATCSVDLLFTPRLCQRYKTVLELTVEDGTGCLLLVQADVQYPHLGLLNNMLLLSDLYIGVPAKATITLLNRTLLPSHFRWMPQLQGKHAELCAVSFEPACGTVGPITSVEITAHFTSNADIELTEVSADCEVQGMNSPLVLNIRASSAKRLSVSYSLPSSFPISSTPDDESPATLVLDFGDVTLRRAVTKQLLITNQTAIPAAFTIAAEHFTCRASRPNNQSEERFAYVKRPLHAVYAEAVEEKARKDFVSSLLAHGKGAAFLVSPETGMLGPFQTQTVDVTAYSDMWGEYRDQLICKVGELRATLIPMQMTVKGCPVYFQMTGLRPDGQNQGPVIQFGTHLSAGNKVSRSLRINNPTMFDIRVDWEIYTVDPSDRKLVDVVVTHGDDFPAKDADANEVLSGALRSSDGSDEPPGSEGTSPSLQSTTDGEESLAEDVCEEEETSVYPLPAKKKLISVHVRPHMGKLSDNQYYITPRQIVIPAKGRGTIHVSFIPLTLSGSVCTSRCVGYAMGFLSLDSETAACVPGKVGRAQGFDSDPLRVDFLAFVKPAVLSVQTEENEELLEFRASAGDLLRGDPEKLVVREFDITQTLELKNNLEMPLHFHVDTQPPFAVLKPQPRARTSDSGNPPSGDCQPLVLKPRCSMQVTVAFHCSMSLLDFESEEVPPGAGGQRKLRFQQNLLLHYSNNIKQTVPLRADLDLAAIHLSTDGIDFGLCYVGQTQTREVSLCSQGVPTYWNSQIDPVDGDSHVFTMTPGVGLLRTKELHVTSCCQCLQISFTPSGDREFRATVVIRSPLVKTPLTLQLQGTGSLDE